MLNFNLEDEIMLFLKKAKNKDPRVILVENYYQCIYYLTVSDLGDEQNLKSHGESIVLNDIRIDKEDKLLVHSDNGTYNLHLITSKNKFLSKCVKKIIDITNSGIDIDYEELNKRLQAQLHCW